MKMTNIILTACLGGGFLLWCAGCPSKPSEEPPKPQAEAGASAQNAVNENKNGEDAEKAQREELNKKLHAAAKAGDVAQVKSLIAQGASGGAVLATEAMSGQQKAVSTLIEAGVDVNSRLLNNMTPLMLAKSDAIPVLIQAGADVNAQDAAGCTPLRSAVTYAVKASLLSELEKPEMIREKPEMIREKPEEELEALKRLQMLIQAGANVNVADSKGGTPLMEACREGIGMADVVRALIEAGADVNAKDNDGKTALDMAKTDEIKGLLKAVGQSRGGS